MGLILDADVIIADERGAFDLREFFRSHANEEFAIPSITAAEILHGVERATGAHHARRKRHVEEILASVASAPYTAQTAAVHARIWAELERAGTMIGPYDLIVAATALEMNFAVVTFNQKHYTKVNGLTVIVPQTPSA